MIFEITSSFRHLNHFSYLLSSAPFQSAFIYYISDMAEIGLNAVKEAPQFFLVFPDSDQGEANANAINQEEVNFMGAIGITGVFAYGFSFVGAIAFMQFSLYAFRSGNPHHRNASYFQSRLTLYTFFLFLSGLCQILLGSFATELTSSDGRIEGGAIRVAMFVVHFPYLTIALGIVQFINGFWGFVRSFGVFVGDENDNSFQYSMAFQFVITLTCQFIVQISLLPEALLAPTIPSFAALSLGIHLMPAFLEYKMRTTPKEIYDDYYFSTASDEAVAERQPMIKKAVPTKRPLELRKIYVVERDAVVGIDEVDFYDGPNGEDGEAAQRWI